MNISWDNETSKQAISFLLGFQSRKLPRTDEKKRLVEAVFSLFEREIFLPLLDQDRPTEHLAAIVQSSYHLSSLHELQYIDQVLGSVRYFIEKAEITTGLQSDKERVRDLAFKMVSETKWFIIQEIDSHSTWDNERLLDVASYAVMLYLNF